MLDSLKRLTKHSLVYGIGHIVSRFMGFLLMPIHTNIFPPEIYRTPTLLFSALAIMNVVFTYGIDTAFLRFFILEESRQARQRIFSTVFFTILTTGLFFSLILLLFPGPFSELIFKSADYKVMIRLASGILLTDALSLIPFLILRAEEKSAQFVTVRTVNIVLNLGLNILFVAILRKGITYIFVANLIASTAALLMLMPVIVRWLRLKFSRHTLLELLNFGLPYIPSVLSVIVMDKIGNFYLDRMAGEKWTGIFSAGCKLGMFMALVVSAFRFAWHPFFLSTYKQDNAKEIFARVMTYFLMVTGFFFLLVSFFIKEILQIRPFGVGLIGADYTAGIIVVPVIMLAYIAYGVYTHFIIGVFLKSKSMYVPIVTGLGGITSLVANELLISHMALHMKIMGAAWAVALSYIVMAGAMYFVNRHLYPITYESRRIFKIILVFGGLFFLHYFLLDQTGFLIRLLCLLMIVPLLYILQFFEEREIRAIKRMIFIFANKKNKSD